MTDMKPYEEVTIDLDRNQDKEPKCLADIPISGKISDWVSIITDGGSQLVLQKSRFFNGTPANCVKYDLVGLHPAEVFIVDTMRDGQRLMISYGQALNLNLFEPLNLSFTIASFGNLDPGLAVMLTFELGGAEGGDPSSIFKRLNEYWGEGWNSLYDRIKSNVISRYKEVTGKNIAAPTRRGLMGPDGSPLT